MTKQKDTGEPAYFSYVRNEISMGIVFDHMRSIEVDGGFLVEGYGHQIFVKGKDFDFSDKHPIHIKAELINFSSITNLNRSGYKIASLTMENKVFTEEIKEEWYKN